MSAKKCEMLVIGEGLAGITAAATAAAQGLKVTLVSKGPGSFVLGSAGVNLDGLDVKQFGPVEQDTLETGLDFFLQLTSAAQYAYGGGPAERRLVPNILGTFQRVALAPRSLWQADPRSASHVVVAGIANLSGFDANFIAERLSFHTREMGLSNAYRGDCVTLPHNPKHALTAMEIATHIDRDPEYRAALVKAFKPVAQEADLLIIPGVLGVKFGDADLVCFEEEVGCAVSELATLPPSVPALRLLQRLELRLDELGVEISTGFSVQKLCVEGDRCIAVELETPGRARRLECERVTLACGRYSQLLESTPLLFNGCACSTLMNVFACGSLLGQFEPRHRNAVSILTGHQAGLLASRQGVQYAGR